MSLDAYADVRSKVTDINKRLRSTLDDIRDNRSYSESGRRVEMAKATLAARQEAQALQTRFIAARNERRTALEKRLFGATAGSLPAELMVLWDSHDRARRLETEDAARDALRLAGQFGDTVMARAIAQRAIDKGWADVVDAYAESAGTVTRELLDELANIPDGKNTNAADKLAFRITPPPELGQIGDADLASLAEGAAR